MPLSPPNLDDRTFADLMEEAKRLIPRYAPEWTDHNESDPGIALLQLYAWFVEVAIYRLNRVPERNYIKFLQLLGIELEAARPARVELEFELSRTDVDHVIVPRGTQAAVSDPEGDAPILFETDRALIALGARLSAVQVFDGFAHGVVTTHNDAEGQWFHPFGPGAREGSALMLGFESELPFTAEQVDLAFDVHTEGMAPEGRHCDLDLSRIPPPAEVAWEFWDGTRWSPIIVDQDETRAFTRSGHVRFPGPGSHARRMAAGRVAEPLYWLRVRLVRTGYDRAPRLERVATNTVPATQAITIQGEILGGSDGRPNQSFTLARRPVVALPRPERVVSADGRTVEVRGLQLEIDEGGGFEIWQEVDDFLASGRDDPHFVLDRATGRITCGDGDHGRIPLPHRDKPGANVIARRYQSGGGRHGNVGSERITELQDSIDGIAAVSNRRPATGGSDEGTVAEAKARAAGLLKSRERAVTEEDFEYLARQTPGYRILRSKALALTHPRFPGATVPGSVTVIVVPDSDAPDPAPGRETLSAVCAHLNAHRLVTTEVHVVPPRYRHVRIEARVVVRSEADLSQVRRSVEARLDTWLHPLRGGEQGTGWPFGRPILFSDAYRVVLTTEGVQQIHENQLVVHLDGEAQPVCRDVPIEAGELVYATGHDIHVTYEGWDVRA